MDMGQTRVELGVQTTYDDVLSAMKRGHGVKEATEANRLARDAGLKVGFHMMPGMPGVSREMDLKTFEDLFEDDRFKPDMLKIYPCLVIKGTGLYDIWKRGEYEPLTTEQATEILAKAKAKFPKWVRVQRIQRDIPVQLIDAGVDKSNLRQLVHRRMEADGTRCRCVRCREVGHRTLKGDTVDDRAVKLVEERYGASGGKEVFLSFEDTVNDILISYLRLRLPGEWWREGTENSAFVREMKVIGPVVPLGKRDQEAWQHSGQGEKLLQRAEEISGDEFGMERLLVTSGVGAREYYRQHGYTRGSGPYMEKDLKERS
jgi:elongator complex protein 3